MGLLTFLLLVTLRVKKQILKERKENGKVKNYDFC